MLNETLEANDFGSPLANARQSQNLTIDDITEHLKIPGRIIIALEKSDLTKLPEPIFAQGYLRAYAKFLEVPEDFVLKAYNRAIPHDPSKDLKSSSSIPNETNSQSTWVKFVSIILLLAGVAAAIYAGYQYYQEKADIMDSELESKEDTFTGNSLDSPGKQRLNIKQSARLTEDGELLVSDKSMGEKSMGDKFTGNKSGGINAVTSPSLNPAASAIAANTDGENSGIDAAVSKDKDKERIKQEKRKQAAKQKLVATVDVIEFIAKEDAWLEVRDASSKRLFYNMLKQGTSKSFKGRAPFRLSLGNARTTRVLINNVDVNMQRYIRPSNTAGVTISSEKGKVIFH